MRSAEIRFAVCVALSAPLLPLACGGAADSRPSIVLIVVDTLRASAVSAYGEQTGTTPAIDAVAARGVRYQRAYAPSSWTLPSHASLLTGLGVAVHRVGTPGRVSLPEEVVTLAEQLRDAGYETAAFSENMLVSDVFHQLQGFSHRSSTRVLKKGGNVPLDVVVDMRLEVELPAWLAARERRRPFFLFINLFDAHSPYTVRDQNRWVPPGVTRAEMERYAEKPQRHLCGALPGERDLAILRGLYLGDVAEADRKVGWVFDRLAAAEPSRALVRIVTSDHGELFGERRLLGHEFNLRESAIRVPLVIDGAPGLSPGPAPTIIEQPVSLLSLAPAILVWAGVAPDPAHRMEAIPVVGDRADRGEAGAQAIADLFASYSDAFVLKPEEWDGIVEFASKAVPRQQCDSGDKVYGGMATLIRYPFKLSWFERYGSELYDLSWDAEERSDQSAHRPDLVAELSRELEHFVTAAGLAQPGGAAGAAGEEGEEPSEEALESLRALGYIE